MKPYKIEHLAQHKEQIDRVARWLCEEFGKKGKNPGL